MASQGDSLATASISDFVPPNIVDQIWHVGTNTLWLGEHIDPPFSRLNFLPYLCPFSFLLCTCIENYRAKSVQNLHIIVACCTNKVYAKCMHPLCQSRSHFAWLEVWVHLCSLNWKSQTNLERINGDWIGMHNQRVLLATHMRHLWGRCCNLCRYTTSLCLSWMPNTSIWEHTQGGQMGIWSKDKALEQLNQRLRDWSVKWEGDKSWYPIDFCLDGRFIPKISQHGQW